MDSEFRGGALAFTGASVLRQTAIGLALTALGFLVCRWGTRKSGAIDI